jgi:hypothetical protein
MRKANASWAEAAVEAGEAIARKANSRRRVSVQEWQQSTVEDNAEHSRGILQRDASERSTPDVRPLSAHVPQASDRGDSRQLLEAQRVLLAHRLEAGGGDDGNIRRSSVTSAGAPAYGVAAAGSRPSAELFTDAELARVVARILSSARAEAVEAEVDEGDGSQRPSSAGSFSGSYTGILTTPSSAAARPPHAAARPVGQDTRHWAQVTRETLSACSRIDVPLVERVSSALYRRYCAPPSSAGAAGSPAQSSGLSPQETEPVMNSNQWHRFAEDCRMRGKGGLGGGIVLRGDVDIAYKTAIARITGAGTQVSCSA